MKKYNINNKNERKIMENPMPLIVLLILVMFTLFYWGFNFLAERIEYYKVYDVWASDPPLAPVQLRTMEVIDKEFGKLTVPGTNVLLNLKECDIYYTVGKKEGDLIGELLVAEKFIPNPTTRIMKDDLLVINYGGTRILVRAKSNYSISSDVIKIKDMKLVTVYGVNWNNSSEEKYISVENIISIVRYTFPGDDIKYRIKR